MSNKVCVFCNKPEYYENIGPLYPVIIHIKYIIINNLVIMIYL